MSQLKLKVHSGIKSIGCNILELWSDQARIITDLGVPYPGQDPMILREGESLSEARVRYGHLPDIKNLYADQTWNRENSLPTLILISHLHLDHMGGLAYLPEDTPILVHNDTYKLFLALSSCQRGFRRPYNFITLLDGETYDFFDFKLELLEVDHDLPGASAFLISHRGETIVHSGDLRLHGRKPQKTWNFAQRLADKKAKLFLEGSSFAWSSDQENPRELEKSETCIEDNKTFIHYSLEEASLLGDLSLDPQSYNPNKGVYPPSIYCDSEAAWDAYFNAIINPDNPQNSKLWEQKPLADMSETLLKASQSGLVAINLYIANVERAKKANDLAKQAGKTMLWETSFAKVLQAFYPQIDLAILDIPEEKEYLLHGQGGDSNPKDTVNGDFFAKKLEKLIDIESREPVSVQPLDKSLYGDDELSIGQIKKVSLAEVLARPEAFVLQNSFVQRKRLKMLPVTLYLHANGGPLGGDFLDDYEDLIKIMVEGKINYLGLACNGHATPEDLFALAGIAQVERIFPWHTSSPEYMTDCFRRRGFCAKLLEEGKIYKLPMPDIGH